MIDNLSWLPAKGGRVDTSNRAHLALLDNPDRFFFMLFPSVVRQMTGYNTQKTEHDPHCSHVRRVSFTTICSDVYSKHDYSGLESQTTFQPELCPLHKAYCLLSKDIQFAHIAPFNGDGKSLTQALSVLQFELSVPERSVAVNAGMAKQPEGRPQLALELVGWLGVFSLTVRQPSRSLTASI